MALALSVLSVSAHETGVAGELVRLDSSSGWVSPSPATLCSTLPRSIPSFSSTLSIVDCCCFEFGDSSVSEGWTE